MTAPLNLVGQQFGRLVVLKRNGSIRRGSAWLVRCACGAQKTIAARDLPKCVSCGCVNAELRRERATKHGMRATREYESWAAMWARVRAKSGRRWSYYGARGITACERWRDFSAFLADMGPRPLGMSLDRINNDGNYEPSNCRWAAASEQVRNRRTLK